MESKATGFVGKDEAAGGVQDAENMLIKGLESRCEALLGGELDISLFVVYELRAVMASQFHVFNGSSFKFRQRIGIATGKMAVLDEEDVT